MPRPTEPNWRRTATFRRPVEIEPYWQLLRKVNNELFVKLRRKDTVARKVNVLRNSEEIP